MSIEEQLKELKRLEDEHDKLLVQRRTHSIGLRETKAKLKILHSYIRDIKDSISNSINSS